MKISITGAAGTVGSCTAFTLAIQGLADEIVMLDRVENVLMSHVMDISAAMTGWGDVFVRGGNYVDMAGSDIVIISSGVHFPAAAPTREKLASNIPMILEIAGNIKKYCPGAIVITVTNPVDLLNYAFYLSMNADRKKLIGYSLNDTIRFRMSAARALGVKSGRVEGLVVGEHPRSPVLLFSSIRVDGRPAGLDETARQNIRDELRNYLGSLEALKAGRTAGWTSAAGLAAIVRAIRDDTGETIPCSAVLDGEYGYSRISMGVPAIIGGEGIRRIPELELPPAEKEELDAVARSLEADSRTVEKTVGTGRR